MYVGIARTLVRALMALHLSALAMLLWAVSGAGMVIPRGAALAEAVVAVGAYATTHLLLAWIALLVIEINGRLARLAGQLAATDRLGGFRPRPAPFAAPLPHPA